MQEKGNKLLHVCANPSFTLSNAAKLAELFGIHMVKLTRYAVARTSMRLTTGASKCYITIAEMLGFGLHVLYGFA